MKAVSLLALACLALASCSTTPKEPDPSWQSDEVEVPSDDILWKVSLQSLQKMGFPLGSGLDPSSMVVVSGWRTDLQPFHKAGSRTKAELHMEPVRKGVWRVESRVKKQVNKSLVKKLDPTFADWVWVADDTTAARILIQHIRAYLQPAIHAEPRPADPLAPFQERQGRPAGVE
jgi:hypothetical protein